MQKRWVSASTLVGVIVLAASAAVVVVALRSEHPPRPEAGLFYRSKVDDRGHARGIVQVDLMRRLIAGHKAPAPPVMLASEPGRPALRIPSQSHPLLGRPAPAWRLRDIAGSTWSLDDTRADGPVVIVFHLGFTCVACVTHLVELDLATPSFLARDARVVAVSSEAPDFTRDRLRKFGGMALPLLTDPDHSVSRTYGVWNPVPGGGPDEGEALHGTFIINRAGVVCWAHVGDRPFRHIEALLAELESD